MTIELIKIIPLERNYTQIPNELIRNPNISNDTFRALAWLMSLRGGAISARQIAKAANAVHDGRPHRRIMRDLRTLGILKSRRLYQNGKVAGEFLEIDLNATEETTGRSKQPTQQKTVEKPDSEKQTTQQSPGRSKRPTGRAKRPTGLFKTTEPLKTKSAGTLCPQKAESAPARKLDASDQAEKAKRGAIAASFGLRDHSKDEADEISF
jgi:hypothetical protein